MTAPASGALPEIGPLLGRLAGWSEEGVLADGILGPIRLGLVDAILERAGVARRHLAAGNITSARSAIGRPAWLSEWERAVAAASAAVAEEAERRLRHAAIAARYPAKRLASLLPDV
ncbi:MAG: hypothetical protein HOP28_06925 [Gemmatimonadales bacterium]|nr:hypothetical protein [Gemmatimonadales bacterium]